MKRFRIIVLLSVAEGLFSLALSTNCFAQELACIAAVVPRKVTIFAAEGSDGTYDRNSIYDYIDGGAEVYLSYGMRGCHSRRYVAHGEPDIMMDLFDMGNSADAFGVFTHDRDGEPADVGEDGLTREGWIRFWKGRFFVSIYTERETSVAREAAFRLAQAIEAGIKEKGERPRILGRLPKGGLRYQSVRYLHSHILLDTHVRLSDENILGLGPDTEVVLASYIREGKRARLLLVSYPDAARAVVARDRYRSLRPAGDAAREMFVSEDGMWSGSSQVGRLLAVVLDAESQPLAEALLREAQMPP